MAVRLFDVYNADVGSTQVLGVTAMSVSSGRRPQSSQSDGTTVVAARDKTVFYADATLATQDPTGLPTILAQFEANETQTIVAEGKEQGAANSYAITFNRAKLTSAALQLFNPGGSAGYSTVTYGFANSAASGSNDPSDELAITDLSGRTVAVATRKRGVRVTGATYTPSDGTPASAVPLGVVGFSLNIQGQVARTSGDADFGEVVEVAGYEITGQLDFRDFTLSTGQTIAQVLLDDSPFGSLAITYTESGAATSKTLTVANLEFETDNPSLIARQFATVTCAFGCRAVNGSNLYTLATGSNKIITVA